MVISRHKANDVMNIYSRNYFTFLLAELAKWMLL
ncbi:hypothetical protein HMPREF1536_03008 [Parabacteroides gordonii MS-1 = DSM 23371]|uniref:Uncharacterized protein n=1 Tax=Parabacteroides gordonii MS-1 = DSM 23371 TaxID=1203610 RepID=A0A0F5JDM8_9BACT|nr:hypothetical protein HMPREF1536_03008 [Parabacteroides gordonii MS-1 = DSM 23371]